MEEATALVNARALFTLPCYESVLVFMLCRAPAAYVCVCGFFPTPRSLWKEPGVVRAYSGECQCPGVVFFTLKTRRSSFHTELSIYN